MEFDYEEFIGERGKTYYAIPFMKNITERVAAVKLMAHVLKVKKDKLALIPVWVQRCVWDEDESDLMDWMWLESTQDAVKMMAIVRK